MNPLGKADEPIRRGSELYLNDPVLLPVAALLKLDIDDDRLTLGDTGGRLFGLPGQHRPGSSISLLCGFEPTPTKIESFRLSHRHVIRLPFS
jgi:hypothetical protein